MYLNIRSKVIEKVQRVENKKSNEKNAPINSSLSETCYQQSVSQPTSKCMYSSTTRLKPLSAIIAS